MFRVRDDAWKARGLGPLTRYLTDQLGPENVSFAYYRSKGHKRVYVRDDRTATLLRMLISDCLRPTDLGTGETYERIERFVFNSELPEQYQSADYSLSAGSGSSH